VLNIKYKVTKDRGAEVRVVAEIWHIFGIAEIYIIKVK